MKRPHNPFDKRLDRPPPQSLPDRVAWKAKHGMEPFDLDVANIRAASAAQDLSSHAAAAAELHNEDWSTLDARKVHQLHAQMDVLCEGVAGLFRLTDETLVFFDSERRVFVAYPTISK